MPQECDAPKDRPDRPIASPFSTGGGGTVFELKVQTGLLATLLVRGHVPLFGDAIIHELHLQTEHLGYKTDDALVVALDSNGRQHRQLWSMKHEVKFTQADEVFRDVIKDAWADFTGTQKFNLDLDAIVLSTGPLVAVNKHLLTLLELARAAASADNFHVRVGRKGFVSQKSQEYLALIKKLCSDVTGREITPEELWKFCRCFRVLSYDFDQGASQDEARFKTLLALAVQKEGRKTGDELWNAIFTWVANLNPRAGSFTRDSLPVEWRQASTSVGAYFESGAIHRLLEHSGDLLKRIRTSLGPKLHLERNELTDRLSVAFVDEPFTLVTGQAGVGKSAAALVALRSVLGGAPLFVFQATEFARDNLDHALADLRVTEPFSGISALFTLHPRKFVLIESVERLLESTQRDAFFMLLGRLAEDPTWRVVLTCRQHAASMVQDAFLTPLGLTCVEVAVPLLNESELEEVLQKAPGLRSVISNPRTRELLRNPWFLDKAFSVDWSKESSTDPLDQGRLRDILWRQVVVREDVRAGGIHLQRDRCFRDIALRRARSLQSFVSTAPGEEAAIQALVADELLVEEPDTHRVAPAHDVLEDWALVRWVAETFLACEHDPKKFFDTLGHELSIRRSYRQWLQETLAGGDLAQMRTFVDAVLTTPGVEPYWKDETLVSVLLSNEAPRFLDAHEATLLTNGKRQLQTLIHLLRIACKKPNPLWGAPERVLGKVFGDMYLVPEGKAWAVVIQLIHRNLAVFDVKELPLVLGLLEDWKTSINWQAPTPDAAREAGLIALHFWNALDDHYSWQETFERLASVLLAAPQEISTEFENLLQAHPERDGRHYRTEVLEKKLLSSLECWAACRSHPLVVAKFAERKWGIDHPMPKKSAWDREGSLEMDDHFGLRTAFRLDYFPASGLQGPFLALLKANPETGIDLILKLSNVATERFVELGLDDKYGQGPIELNVDFGGGVTCKQWANRRLWLMYRGGMPGPNVFESALMALEKWLLDLAQAGQDLRDLTRALILRSNSVTVTAVVVSVAMAHPQRVGDTALAILRVPEFFDFDLQRYLYDQSPVSSALGGWGLGASKRLHSNERVESDKLPHRKYNLESFACNLQTGPLREEVWKLIDEFKTHLPPPEGQNEGHKLWRLRLHRIDLRKYSPQEQLEDGRVLFALGPPDPDVAEVVEKSAPALKANEEATSILVWGMSVFEGREPDKFDPGRWREMLGKARHLAKELEKQKVPEILSYEGGPGYVAAVCVRDHWSELSQEEQTWCREFLLLKVLSEKDTNNQQEQIQKFSMASSRAAAQVLPLLLDDADESTRQKVREAIACAITHAIEEVREYAAISIGWHLWERDAGLASACIAGLIDLAQLERRSYGKWRSQSHRTRHSFHDFVWRCIDKVRARIASGKPIEDRLYYRFSVTELFSARVLPLIARIIVKQQTHPVARKLHLQISKSFVNSWKRGRYHDGRRNYEAESILKTQFGNFIVQCEPSIALELWNPFANAIADHPEEVAEIFEWLILAEDTVHKGGGFWAIWGKTAECVLSTPKWPELMANERRGLAKIGAVLLLDGIPWKEDAKDWKPLHGHQDKIRDFFKATGTASRICRAFIRLLDSVGSFLLPEALVWLDEQLNKSDSSQMISDRNSLFSLTRILTPLVFSQTGTLRKAPVLRDATLRILNRMVEQGSSAAFRMREFLITPAVPTGE